MRLLPNDRTVHDFIFKQQDKGATLRGACMKLGMTISDARHSFCRLGKSGEIYRSNGVYKSTAWREHVNPTPTITRVQDELIDNGHKLPPEMDAFLEEYVAARNIGMTPAQARRLAERRYRKEAGVG
ncbi:hypothetical protein ES703_00813 [subsurface metagenome]